MKQSSPRFVIITFESITEDSAGGIGNLSYALSKYLFKHNYELVFYTINKGPNSTEFPSKSVHWTSRYFLYFLNLALRYNLFHSTAKRKIEEWYFDYFLSKHNLTGDYLITTHAFIPRTLKKHANKFTSTNYIPPTPNEEVIFSLCTKELAKVNGGSNYYDAYTDKDRLNYFKKSLPFFSKIISISPITSESFYNTGIKVVEFPFVSLPKKKQKSQEYKIVKEQNLIFLYIAYSVLLKGLHKLLEEWQLAELPNAELYIVGPIDKQYQEVFKIKSLGNRNVKYFGYTSNTTPFYEIADVVVVPSLIDGEPHTAIEALIFRKPILISNGCGHAKFIGESVPESVFNINFKGDLANKMRLVTNNIDLFTKKYEQLFDYISHKSFNYNLLFEDIINSVKQD